MKKIHSRYMLVLIAPLWIAGLLSGCTKIQLATSPGTVTATDWMQAKSGAHISTQGRVFYGIGRAAGINNATLLRTSADTQAQKEMARTLKSYFARLVKASGWQGEPEEAQQLIYGLSQATLQKARISDHRFDEQGKALFALCSLPLDTLVDTLQTFPNMGNVLKQEMLSRTEGVHQQWAGAAR